MGISGSESSESDTIWLDGVQISCPSTRYSIDVNLKVAECALDRIFLFFLPGINDSASDFELSDNNGYLYQAIYSHIDLNANNLSSFVRKLSDLYGKYEGSHDKGYHEPSAMEKATSKALGSNLRPARSWDNYDYTWQINGVTITLNYRSGSDHDPFADLTYELTQKDAALNDHIAEINRIKSANATPRPTPEPTLTPEEAYEKAHEGL